MIFTNFIVGLPVMLLCLVMQAAVSFWSVRYYIRRMRAYSIEQRLHAGLKPLLIAMVVMMFGTFLQVMLWGALFLWLGEFTELYEAVYHSAVNFAALGYGDVVMQKPWKLLGPLEAINGVLMLGMSAAALMAILQHMIKSQMT
ncbi:MAG TPA: ion channel [Pseudomonadales bacterium]|nr:ion channel [Pseudomonadales bacterium]